MCLILGLVETVGIRLRISKELWKLASLMLGFLRPRVFLDT